MALLDRRIKRCPNKGCKVYGKNKFGPDLSYCSSCGSELVFVCRKCGSRIEDLGPRHTICASCEADKKDRLDNAAEMAQRVTAGAAAVGAAAAAVLVNAPDVAKGAIQIATDVVDAAKLFKR